MEGPSGVGPASEAEAFRDLIESMRDIVVGFDEAGVIRYMNAAGPDLLGWPADQLIGHSIGEFMHPDDIERALEMVEIVSGDVDDNVEITPALYRLRCRDGSFLPIEFLSVRPGTTSLGHITTVGRWSGDELLHRQVLELLTTGRPIDESFAVVPEFARWRHPRERYAVVVQQPDGERRAFGDELPPLLAGVVDCPAHSPVEVARRTGESVCLTVDELPADCRAAAIEAGLAGCWIVPVADPLFDEPALLMAWSAVGGAPLKLHRYGLVLMEQVLTLILQWRHQLEGLHEAAMHDALTGIANRAGFFARLDQHSPDAHTAVLYVDLDRFKPINDEFGHKMGDLVLIEVTRRMQSAVRSIDLVARLGGDEFAVLCPGIGDASEATAIADRVIRTIAEPMVLGGKRLSVGASVGVAVTDQSPGEWLLDAADRALYDVKGAGRGAWSLADIG